MNVLDAENANYLAAGLLVEELARRVGVIVVCPGSRSSPLAIAAARAVQRAGGGPSSVDLLVATDERCAGFIALGAAACGRVALVVTTSGTAVANLLPAVVEASASGRPLIVLSADRPAELRDCGANQTIEQRGIFSTFVRWSFELPCPGDELDPAFFLSTASEAFSRATGDAASAPGPVHLNCPFREPLAPRVVEHRGATDPRVVAWATDVERRPWRSIERVDRGVELDGTAAAILRSAERGAVCVGAIDDPRTSESVVATARALGWPIVADLAAQVRTVAAADVAAAIPDTVLAGLGDDARTLDADVVLRVGGHVSSRRINAWAARAGRLVVVQDGRTRFDERHRADAVLHGRTSEILAGVRAVGARPSSIAALWRTASDAADRAVAASLADDRCALDEPRLARSLVAALSRSGRPTTLVLGNSMPIRDADMFAERHGESLAIRVNRGASGIDGLVSTAVGAAWASRRASVLFVGDLSLLHDLGGLANVAARPAPVHVVCVNNDGGAIFHFLPIAEDERAAAHFERLFGTPHGLRFEHAAAMFGLSYERATSLDAAERAFTRLAASDRPMLIECATDRGSNVAAHRAMQQRVAAALRSESMRC
jgi:2-succinyl-5-enolpyruvyl-6-hydroxy-3-cyclohexene-1-carboxylate synthase